MLSAKTQIKAGQWWLRSKCTAAKPIRLFCFPYAGGSPAVFKEVVDRLKRFGFYYFRNKFTLEPAN
jgi:hypothetical protein